MQNATNVSVGALEVCTGISDTERKKRAQDISVLGSDSLLEGSHTHPLMCSGSLPFGKCCFVKGTIPQKRSLEPAGFRDQDLGVIVIHS